MEMTEQTTKREAFSSAIAAAGGQAAFAKLMSTPTKTVSQQLVSYWLKKGELPAELVLRTERLTRISRYKLRPDVFCDEDFPLHAA
jgi:DNA-binding transcriptional regulator YdaS (Cro superfamily)